MRKRVEHAGILNVKLQSWRIDFFFPVDYVENKLFCFSLWDCIIRST